MLKHLIVLGCFIFLSEAAVIPDASNETDIIEDNGNYTEVLKEISFGLDPFSYNDDHYSLGAFIRVNWFQAEQICASHGKSLVSIRNEEDSNRLRNFLFPRIFSIGNERFWTSGTDLASDQDWTWFSNGQPLSFSNWLPNEPNNFEGDEHCLEVGVSGRWNDLPCSRRLFFVCEQRCSTA